MNESTDNTLDFAEDWYNDTPKTELIEYANINGIDIGQSEEELREDWAEILINAKAQELRNRSNPN